MWITGRGINEYDYNTPTIIDPSLQYLEVGAGMGEFTPLVVRNNPRNIPIIIDPANYPLMLEMLQFAYERPINEKLRDKISILQERCKIIINPDKVNLINLPLEKALELLR